MKIVLKLGNRDVEFKVDTGFDGECVLSYELFREIEGEESEGPIVELVNGYRVKTSMKEVHTELEGRRFTMLCISAPSFSRNLLGEALLRLRRLKVDYKLGRVEDP